MARCSYDVVTALVAVLVATTAGAADPAEKCSVNKIREAGRYSKCLLSEEYKAVRQGRTPDHAKCEAKLDKRWAVIEAQGGNACPTAGDEGAIAQKLAVTAADIVASLQGRTGDDAAVETLRRAILRARTSLVSAPWVAASADSEEEIARAERHLQHLITLSIQEGFRLDDPLHPVLRKANPQYRQFGLSNPDVDYYAANIGAPGTYVVHGRRGSSSDLQIQVGSGIEGFGAINITPISQLTLDELVVAPDGTFEIVISDTPTGSNWMDRRGVGDRLLIREAFSDWTNEERGTFYVEHLESRGQPNRLPTKPVIEEQFTLAAAYLEASATTWVDFIAATFWVFPNAFLTPINPTPGGLPGQYSSGGKVRIEPGKAVVLTFGPDDARYQAVQLADLWTNSFDFCSRQTSLTTSQAHLGSDGLYHLVISEEDPGVPNWLDPSGAETVLIFFRWQGLANGYVFPPEHQTTMQIVDIGDLSTVLPADEPRVSAEERANQLAERRFACSLR